MTIGTRLRDLMGFIRRTERSRVSNTRGPVTHVILLDGTMSTLEEGDESNVGLIYKLLASIPNDNSLALFYEAGVQWRDWGSTLDVIEGRGINRQIRRAYGWLATRYHPGDRIFLIGFSRGAYAVRSLAGAIGAIGLLKKDFATERMVREAYRHYQCDTDVGVAQAFRAEHCHADVAIEAIGVFDTVKALGFRAPFVWKWAEVKHAFHDHHLGPHVRHGFHALALDETRDAFQPVLWTTPEDHVGHVEQVWFSGSHGDIGGQLNGACYAREYTNIPLIWMLERLERCDLNLPPDWRMRFPVDVTARQIGTWHGWGKFFWARSKRRYGFDASERLHPTAVAQAERTGLPLSDGEIRGSSLSSST